MLRKINIENYALIDSLEIGFREGLNIITGETGAGKSLLLGALSAVLGEKTDTGVMRDPGKPCVIEAEFDVKGLGLEAFFEGADLDYEDTAVIRRVISPNGKTRGFVNELPVNVTTLRELGGKLIDIHSQHQTMLLSNPKFQTDLVDSVAGHGGLLEEYLSGYEALKAGRKRLEKMKADADDARKEEDYFRFQLAELTNAALTEGETEELETLLNELTHASEIKETMLGSEALLSSDDTGALVALKSIEQYLNRIGGVFHKAEELAVRVRSAALELSDISAEMASEGERIDANPSLLEKTESRLNTLYSLLQKHRTTDISGLIALRDDMAEKLSAVENSDAEIEKLEKEVSRIAKETCEMAGRISKNRKAAIPGIEKYVRETTSRLGMPDVKFVIEASPLDELTASGVDKIGFLFSANKNMAPKPVERIASGGEMSRLMLALKSLMARHRQMPTIIFDEIDTGISGEVADKMGQIIQSLSDNLQVINITHLPQVASKGDNHYFVYKESSAGTTDTRIRRLSDEERVIEIAKMLSGTEVTPAAMEQAATLLGIKK